MEYSHNFENQHNFNGHGWMHYFSCGNKLVGLKRVLKDGFTIFSHKTEYKDELLICIYDCMLQKLTYTGTIPLVPHCQFKNASFHWLRLDQLFLIDLENMNYMMAVKTPYFIYEIDGNFVETCRLDNKIYIFHSHTESYKTGLFIYDINTNTYNANDFWEMQEYITETYINEETDLEYDEMVLWKGHTNRFANLQKIDVASCYTHNNQIFIIKWEPDAENKLAIYDPQTDSMIDLVNIPGISIMHCGDYIIDNNFRTIKIYNQFTGQFIKEVNMGDNTECIASLFSYNNKLVCLSTFYENPYGQIYDPERSNKKNLRITQYDINNLINIQFQK